MDYEKYKAESFKENPGLRKEYEALDEEFSHIRENLDDRVGNAPTQQESAESAGNTNRD